MSNTVVVNDYTSNGSTVVNCSDAGTEGRTAVIELYPSETYDGTVTLEWSPDGTNYGAFGSSVNDADAVAQTHDKYTTAFSRAFAAGTRNGHAVVLTGLPPRLRVTTASRTAGQVTAILRTDD